MENGVWCGLNVYVWLGHQFYGNVFLDVTLILIKVQRAALGQSQGLFKHFLDSFTGRWAIHTAAAVQLDKEKIARVTSKKTSQTNLTPQGVHISNSILHFILTVSIQNYV